MAIMKFRVSMFGMLLLSLGVAGAQVASHAPTVFKAPAQSQAPTANPKPVVRINGSVLTEGDLVREEYAIFPYARQHDGLPKDLAPQIRDGALKMMVFEELVYQEALRQKMTIGAVKMQRAEAEFRKQFATPDEFNTFLQTDFHGSEALFQEKIRRSLLIEAFLKIEVDTKSKVSPTELKAFYDNNPVRFQHPEMFTFQTISILPPAKATADQLKEGKTRAEKALRQAKATKSTEEFGLLAEKISDDDYRVMMGQHKPVEVEKLAPQVVAALRAMQPGDVSNIIQMEQAYTIVRLQVHAPAGKAKFDEVRVSLQKELENSKSEQLRATLDKKLRQGAKIEGL
jgi:parvulin-like peptidyl-prolyl isomerase